MGYDSYGERIKNEYPEARIALCKCCEDRGKLYGVRMQREGSGWKYTWAFKLSESSAKREGYDQTDLKGNITPDREYPGCPYCGTNYFIVCGACHKLDCKVGHERTHTCQWCGNVGELSDYDGDGIASGGDLG